MANTNNVGVKKVIIPKGVINPEHTTVIEIPPHLQNVLEILAIPNQPLNNQKVAIRETQPQPSQPQPQAYPTTVKVRAKSPVYYYQNVAPLSKVDGGILKMLYHLETEEAKRINKDLREIQKARRKLVIDASSLKTPSVVLESIYSKNKHQ